MIEIHFLLLRKRIEAVLSTNIIETHMNTAPIGVKMGSKQVLWDSKMMQKVRKTTVFQAKYGGFMVAGEGFEPPTSGL